MNLSEIWEPGNIHVTWWLAWFSDPPPAWPDPNSPFYPSTWLYCHKIKNSDHWTLTNGRPGISHENQWEKVLVLSSLLVRKLNVILNSEYHHHVGPDKAGVPSCASICVSPFTSRSRPPATVGPMNMTRSAGGGHGGSREEDNKENGNKEHELWVEQGRFSAPVAAHRNHKLLMSRFYSR